MTTLEKQVRKSNLIKEATTALSSLQLLDPESEGLRITLEVRKGSKRNYGYITKNLY
ncbi:hypothetical protein [Mangrovimonas xylaniphaga]|uniref:hypothetical protein n=1 Tax=Mangrovimonas xylaniphaga TaxID=1645915 RepID=UPI000ADD2C37|nr:hypothetical protein [Mangrovimonas xylaniphaga]